MVQKKKAAREARKRKKAAREQKVQEEAVRALPTKGDKPFQRSDEVLRAEADLKRDTLHIFRRLQNSQDPDEKINLCAEAVQLFDKIPARCGAGAASSTSGRIVFCNALMECGGLDELRICQDLKD